MISDFVNLKVIFLPLKVKELFASPKPYRLKFSISDLKSHLTNDPESLAMFQNLIISKTVLNHLKQNTNRLSAQFYMFDSALTPISETWQVREIIETDPLIYICRDK